MIAPGGKPGPGQQLPKCGIVIMLDDKDQVRVEVIGPSSGRVERLAEIGEVRWMLYKAGRAVK
jgi:hypothetical protein